jgi:hypothetical protein
MNTLRQMRASDLDREQIVARLRGAFEEGRLTMDEYVARMETACQARTYGELAALCDDLPARQDGQPAPEDGQPAPEDGQRAPEQDRVRAATAATGCMTPMNAFALLPGALKVLWTIWLAIVSVNVVVWATVSLTGPRLVYPWPLWVAGPWGAVLLAISASVVAGRSGRVGRQTTRYGSVTR